MSITIMLLYAALICGFGFFFLGMFPKAPETISVFGEEVKEKKGSVISSILSPLAPMNKVFIGLFKLETPLNNKMYLARWRITPAELLVAKEILCILFVLALYLFDLKNWWLVAAGLLGFFLPDIILDSRVKKRKFQIVRILPETIDLLGLCVGAGLDFMAAVRWVVDKVELNPMIEELTYVLKEINVGKPRVEALRAMSKRVNIPDVTSFVRILIQADRMGTPVEETFKILSEDTRLRRFHRGERQAMKAPIKMLIPLIFCILPVILIIVAGPILIRFIKQGLFEGISIK
ncbi:MAG: type II secretion system F family protein [Candidatus Omnitrophica bacterium]|nr:type II secretion system F family protein [Candidatus Omnitrophota bacterium]